MVYVLFTNKYQDLLGYVLTVADGPGELVGNVIS